MQVFIVLETSGIIDALVRASHHYSSRPLTLTEPARQGQRQIVGHVPDGQLNQRQFMGELYQMVEEEDDRQVKIDPPPVLDYVHAHLIAKALTEETLSQYLQYRSAETPLYGIAQALSRKSNPSELDMQVAENFLAEELVDDAVIDYQQHVASYIGRERWREWQLFDTPRALALVGGQDFRISEWERAQRFQAQDTDHHLSVSIHSVAHYIRHNLLKRLGTGAQLIPIKPLLADAIVRRYPLVRFSEVQPVPETLLANFGIYSYEMFFRDFVAGVMDVFGITYLHTRIDPQRAYRAEITGDFTLVFHHAELPRDVEASYYRDLRSSIERGDWVPERERQRLEAYERR